VCLEKSTSGSALSTILIILAVVAVLALLGVGGYFYIQKRKNAEALEQEFGRKSIVESEAMAKPLNQTEVGTVISHN